MKSIEISQWNTGIQSPHEGIPYIESAYTGVSGEVTSDHAWLTDPKSSVVIGMTYLKSYGQITVYRDSSGHVTAEQKWYQNDDTTLVTSTYVFKDRTGAALTSSSTYGGGGSAVGLIRVAYIVEWQSNLVVVADRDIWYLNSGYMVPIAQSGWNRLSGYVQCAVTGQDNAVYISVRIDSIGSPPYYKAGNPFITSLVDKNIGLNLGDATTFTYTSQALVLSSSTSPTAFTELGKYLVIGTDTNRMYTWDRLSKTFNMPFFLPENGVSSVITANNITYVFCGTEGNIYGTNGTSYWLVTSLPRHIIDTRLGSISWSRSVAFIGNKLYFGANYFKDAVVITADTQPVLAALFSLDVKTQELKVEVKTTSLSLTGLVQWVSANATLEVMPPFDDYFIVNDFPMFSTYLDYQTNSTVVTSDKGNMATANINTPLYVVSDYYSKGTPKRIYLYCSDVPVLNSSISIEQRNSLNGAWTSVGTVTFDGTQDQGMLPFNVSMKRQFQLRIKIIPTTYTSGGNTYAYAPKLQSVFID